jgi:hypothetical protein
MAGITLTADEIKAAPPEVRRWLEQEIVRAFGVPSAPAPAGAPALIGCNVEEAREMLALVQGMLPVVSVLFELGREAAKAWPCMVCARSALPTSCAMPGCSRRIR